MFRMALEFLFFASQKTFFSYQEPNEKRVKVEDEELGAEMAVSWPLNVQGMFAKF